MRRARGAAAAWAILLLGAMSAPAAPVEDFHEAEILSFSDLEGWETDDLADAFEVFTSTCRDMTQPDWAAVCAFASTGPDPRRFFETFFRPVRIGGGLPALFTGYFEPELRASAEPDERYRHPVYRLPPELTPGEPWLTRAEIEDGALEGQDLEIAWLRDPVDHYFLQVQGSGRLRMTDGRMLRLGYAGRNGHPRNPISAELVRQGVYEPHQVSSAVIRNWVRRHPEDGRKLLQVDPSYVFFRVLDGLPEESGPLGAMNRELTAGRSLAVDPAYTPLGAPVWIEKAGAEPMARLMVAQDTGGAIKGPQRADIFFGTGSPAEREASRIRDTGRMIVLMPIEQAFTLAMGS